MIGRMLKRVRTGRKNGAQDGTGAGRYDVKVDHVEKIITGNVYLGRAGGCPHKLARRCRTTGDIIAHEPCTGEAGHPSERHADRFGRIWS